MGRTIFLVNQISGHGHLDLYARLYSAILLEFGYSVILIAEMDCGVSEWLAANRIRNRENFVLVRRDELTSPREGRHARDASQVNQSEFSASQAPFLPPVMVRAVRVWRTEGFWGVYSRCSIYIGKFCWLLAGPSFAIVRRALGWKSESSIGLSFVPIVKEILLAQERLQLRPDLVFFLYLDLMSDDRQGCRYLEKHLKTPWAGILFHPRFRGGRTGTTVERYFRCHAARGAAFLNPHCLAFYRKALPNLHFGVIPDATDVACATREVALASRIKTRAAGRAIVLLIGSLAPHKGIMPLLEVVRRADPELFFFAIVGEVFWDAFGSREPELRAFAAQPPENCLFHPEYIHEEAELNAVIASSDILYAVYDDFRDSSNSLTKVASFEKPILVSNEYLMGELVMRHNLGATVRPGDVDGIISALASLRDRPRHEFGFADYRRLHSVEALQEGLKGLLDGWLHARCQ